MPLLWGPMRWAALRVPIPAQIIVQFVLNLQLFCCIRCIYRYIVMPPPVGRGQWGLLLSVRPSVCLSVRPSVAYTANNWRIRAQIRNKGSPFVYEFNVKRSKIKVTRTINADTPYAMSSERQGLRTSNLVHGWTATSRISHRHHDLKGQGRKVTWSLWAVLAQCCTCVISGRWGHTVSAEPGGHTSCYMRDYSWSLRDCDVISVRSRAVCALQRVGGVVREVG